MSEGRRRVTGSRRQSRRRGASAIVAVPPMRCTRAGPRVRGRLGVLAGRSGSTCDASVSATCPCSQRRRLRWMWRYPLVKKGPGPSIPLRARRGPGRGVPSSDIVGQKLAVRMRRYGLRCDSSGSRSRSPGRRCWSRSRSYCLRISGNRRMRSLVECAREVHHDVWGARRLLRLASRCFVSP